MDVDALITQVGPLATAAVAKWGESALTKAGDTAATESVKLGQRLLATLFSRAKAEEPVRSAVADLVSAIDDPDFQAALRAQLKKVLREDPALAAELSSMLATAGPSASERGIAIGGDNTGIASSGDGAINIQRR
ncbi:hypothetical protein [Kutzneria sp. NPDC051319]|uniref:hypothetical protein n=1 Tax=Kutzneria sp. NPDC051319 TaxID=3155047 RepID=UPI00344A6391